MAGRRNLRRCHTPVPRSSRPCENRGVATFYDIDRANERLDELRPALEQLRADRKAVAAAQHDLESLRRSNGSRAHAEEVTSKETALHEIVRRMEATVARIDEWSITLRDIETGLVDFPALASGRQIWLCWRLGEPAVAWWHELTTGVAGRRPLIDLD
jgi:hypothetical protein